MKQRTYLDSGVLIHAWLGTGETARRSLNVLNDPEREFVTSVFVALELIPTTLYHRDTAQQGFVEAYQNQAQCVGDAEAIITRAFIEGAATGTAGIDACHLAAAALAGVDQLVTAEKPTKPICRSKTVPVVSVRWAGAP